MQHNWHYAKGGDRRGPITAAQLKELATTGQLAPDDLVWREDMKEWRKASTVKGLFPEQRQVTPAAPAPRPRRASRAIKRLAWLGVVGLLIVVLMSFYFIERHTDTPADVPRYHTAADDSQDLSDPSSAIIPSQPASSTDEIVYEAGLDTGEGPYITNASILSFVGKIHLPGGYRTHGEIRDARYVFSSDSKQFFMGANGRGANHPLYSFDTMTGQMKLHIPEAHPRASFSSNSISSVAISSDDRLLATGFRYAGDVKTGGVCVWEISSENGLSVNAIPKYRWPLASPNETTSERELLRSFDYEYLLHFSDDFERLYYANTIEIGCLDLTDGTTVYRKSVEWPIRGIDKKRNVFWSLEDNGFHQWSCSDGNAVGNKVLSPVDSLPCVRAIQADNGTAYAAFLRADTNKYECRLVDGVFSEFTRITFDEYPRAATLSSDGVRLVVAFEKRFVMYDCKTGQQIVAAEGFDGRSVQHLCMSPDGSWLLTSSFTQGLYVFRIYE